MADRDDDAVKIGYPAFVSVRHLFCLFPGVYRSVMRRIGDALERVGLTAHADVAVFGLSAGIAT